MLTGSGSVYEYSQLLQAADEALPPTPLAPRSPRYVDTLLGNVRRNASFEGTMRWYYAAGDLEYEPTDGERERGGWNAFSANSRAASTRKVDCRACWCALGALTGDSG